jgi:hypothetical protein
MKISNTFKILSLILCLSLFTIAQDTEPIPPPRVVGDVTVKATKANIDPLYFQLRNLSEGANSFSGEYASASPES